MGVSKSTLGMSGTLGVRVIRAHPTLRQRISDLVRRVIG
jgi:hypothetical protein